MKTLEDFDRELDRGGRAWGNRHGKLLPSSLIVFSGLSRKGKYGPHQP